MSQSLDEFRQHLVRSGLVNDEEISSFVAGLPGDNPIADAAALARELVSAGRLTKYQTTAIFQGKTQGLVLGKYVVLDKIGAGGMGQVFKAFDRRLERVVALKLLPAAALGASESAGQLHVANVPRIEARGQAMAAPEAVARLQREARAAARLQHPNIVTVFDADEADGVYFLAMEYLDGRDLASLVKERHPLPFEQVVDYILQAARGLEYAHRHGIVHRDIKPANLLLDNNGTVKILDMGLARFVSQVGDAFDTDTGGLTQTGQVIGTVDFMSPEQAEDTRSADERSDIYSLGCTLYVLLTDRPPYAGETLIKKFLAHLNAEIPSIRALRPDVPAAVDLLLQKMMAKRPDGRFSSAGELITAFNAVAKLVTIPSPVIVDTPPESMATCDTLQLHDLVFAGQGNIRPTAVQPSSVHAMNTQAPPSQFSAVITDTVVSPSHASAKTAATPTASQQTATTTPVRPTRRNALPLGFLVVCGVAAFFALAYGIISQRTTSNPRHGNTADTANPSVIKNSIGMTFLRIEPGEFEMGSPLSEKQRSSDETLHHVRLTKPYHVSVYEVTQRDWISVMGNGTNPSWFSHFGPGSVAVKDLDTSQFPVENISWEDAQAFCKKLSEMPAELKAGRKYRLPTSAEWEFACRADTATPFYTGNEMIGNAKPTSLGRVAPVGEYRSNAWGLYDMHGNVGEWCSDRYRYDEEPATDPVGPESGGYYVCRGGGWDTNAKCCRSACRNPFSGKSNQIGFRVVFEVVEPKVTVVKPPTNEAKEVVTTTPSNESIVLKNKNATPPESRPAIIEERSILPPDPVIAGFSKTKKFELAKNLPVAMVADLERAVQAIEHANRYVEFALSRAGGGLSNERKREICEDYYNALTGLGAALVSVDPADAAIKSMENRVNGILTELVKNPPRLRILALLAERSLSTPSHANRGLCVVGTVRQIETRGTLFEIYVELETKDKTVVTVYSGDDPKSLYNVGAKVLLLGATVANPQRNLTGYQGMAAEVGCVNVHSPIPVNDAKPFVGNNANLEETLVIRRNAIENSVKMKLVEIPPGEFDMGSPASETGRFYDENRHHVRITRGFWLGAHEVTQFQFRRLLGSTPAHFSRENRGKLEVKGQDTASFPVESVTWFDAAEFCNALSKNEDLPAYYTIRNIVRTESSISKADVSEEGGMGYRLPTESEWEYACRAGTTTPFHLGAKLIGRESNVDGNYPNGTSARNDSPKRPRVVGNFVPNKLGLYDMHGNVREWCNDRYGVYPHDIVDPRGPGFGRDRVLRGGSFATDARLARSASRFVQQPSFRTEDLGFRVARTSQ